MGDITHMLWIDLETTGTNEVVDEIIEFAAILTDTNFTEIDRKECPLRVRKEILDIMDDFVKDMHKKSGLLDILLKTTPTLPWIYDYEYEVINWLQENKVEPNKVILAGSGVSHFDRRFLKEHMPDLEDYLYYAPYDVGVLRRTLEFADMHHWIPQWADEKNHRAMNDIERHLNEAKYYRDRFHDVLYFDF